MLLAIDTASETCAIAILRGEDVIERAEHVGQRHSERLIPMIEALLAEAGVCLTSLDAVAFGAGPGSFTGLRIACGVAQGLAYAIDRPVVAVGNLEALAFNAACQAPEASLVAAGLDARMGECYWAAYRIDREADRAIGRAAAWIADDSCSSQRQPTIRLSEQAPPSLSRPEALAHALIALAPDTLAGQAFTVFSYDLDRVEAVSRQPATAASAAAIARLGAHRLRAGLAVAPSDASPIYVRDRIAQTTVERQAQRAARVA